MSIHKVMGVYTSPASISGINVARWLSWSAIVSIAWISKPLEFPLALLSPLVFAFIALLNLSRIKFPFRYFLYLLFSIFFLITHYFLDRIDAGQLVWQFMRVSMPLLGLAFFLCNWKILDRRSRELFCRNAIIGCTVVLGSEAIIRVAVYPAWAIGSISGDLVALYDFKSASFLFKDGNVCAFVATYIFCYLLIAKLNNRQCYLGYEDSKFLQVFLIVTIYLSFSRQAWFAALSSVVIYLVYRILDGKFPRIVAVCDSPFFIITLISFGLMVFLFASEEVISNFNEINQDSFGSASTKFAIANYTALFMSEASVLDVLIGIGPQNIIDKNVISYVGHSLIGLFPEFGLSIFLIVFIWFRRIRGGLILFPLIAGSVLSLYPLAYLLPVYILHSTLPSARVDSNKILENDCIA